jgi:hypothetical protein
MCSWYPRNASVCGCSYYNGSDWSIILAAGTAGCSKFSHILLIYLSVAHNQRVPKMVQDAVCCGMAANNYPLKTGLAACDIIPMPDQKWSCHGWCGACRMRQPSRRTPTKPGLFWSIALRDLWLPACMHIYTKTRVVKCTYPSHYMSVTRALLHWWVAAWHYHSYWSEQAGCWVPSSCSGLIVACAHSH